MKLLLTSAGLANSSIARALNELVNLPPDKVHIAFIPTAANAEEGDKTWLIEDYVNIKKQGYGCVDIVDISALPRNVWKPRLEAANVLFVGGGSTFHLMRWVQKSGLDKLFPKLLTTRVYAGTSAGSCITGPIIYNSVKYLVVEQHELQIKEGLGWVDFQLVPHLNSTYFDKLRADNLREAVKALRGPIYAVDDNTAVKVVDENIEVISEGKYLVLNQEDSRRNNR